MRVQKLTIPLIKRVIGSLDFGNDLSVLLSPNRVKFVSRSVTKAFFNITESNRNVLDDIQNLVVTFWDILDYDEDSVVEMIDSDGVFGDDITKPINDIKIIHNRAYETLRKAKQYYESNRIADAIVLLVSYFAIYLSEREEVVRIRTTSQKLDRFFTEVSRSKPNFKKLPVMRKVCVIDAVLSVCVICVPILGEIERLISNMGTPTLSVGLFVRAVDHYYSNEAVLGNIITSVSDIAKVMSNKSWLSGCYDYCCCGSESD